MRMFLYFSVLLSKVFYYFDYVTACKAVIDFYPQIHSDTKIGHISLSYLLFDMRNLDRYSVIYMVS
jgi:hypothetical protein